MRYSVIDTSCLRALDHLGLATKLSLFFDVIFVPKYVQTELNRKHRFRYRLNKLYSTGIFRQCLIENRTSLLLLLTNLDLGEAEVLAQAQERGADYVILDERTARTVAQNMSINAVGTVRLLARLHRDGHLEKFDQVIKRLRTELRFRVGEDVLEEAISRAGEPI